MYHKPTSSWYCLIVLVLWWSFFQNGHRWRLQRATSTTGVSLTNRAFQLSCDHRPLRRSSKARAPPWMPLHRSSSHVCAQPTAFAGNTVWQQSVTISTACAATKQTLRSSPTQNYAKAVNHVRRILDICAGFREALLSTILFLVSNRLQFALIYRSLPPPAVSISLTKKSQQHSNRKTLKLRIRKDFHDVILFFKYYWHFFYRGLISFAILV